MILKYITTRVLVIGVSVLITGAVCYTSGVRINTSASIPVGLYWITNAPVVTGHYVIFCPPATRLFAIAKKRGYITAGFCPGGYGYMMKKILAAKGDSVVFTDSGVLVNGKLLPHSKPLATDPGGRPLPHYPSVRYKLNKNQVLLMSENNNLSFDGRYFGPLDRMQIKSVIRPVFTWIPEKKKP